MVVEAKDVGKKLAGYDEQLGDYFAKSPETKLGVLTSGAHWRFFTDVVHPNVMDKAPFADWMVLGEEPPPYELLILLQKSQFNPQLVRTFAERKHKQNLLVSEIERLLEPSLEFTKLAIQNLETRNLTEKVVETWKPVVAGAIAEWAKQATLSSVISQASRPEPEDSEPKIITTKEELEGYETVRRLLGDDRPVEFEDTVSYFKIHLAGKRTWVMCRLHFDRKRPTVSLPLSVDDLQGLGVAIKVASSDRGWSLLALENYGDVAGLGTALCLAYDRVKSGKGE